MSKSEIIISKYSPIMQENFTFGVATSAFQIEGSPVEGGKVDSIWDTFCRESNTIKNGDNGDLACEHYLKWQDDIALMKSMNIEAYRLSISWPRIINSIDRNVNQVGLEFYQKLIDSLIEQGIKPYITLYHWDLPQYLQDIGGWENRQTAEDFAFYADVVSKYLGNKVAAYSTFNEPWVTSFLGHLHGIHAPGKKSRKAAYHSAHYQLLAHGLALPLLRKNAPKSLHGIVMNGGPCQAGSECLEDKDAAIIAYQEQVDLFLSPLFKGKYPELLLLNYIDYLPENFELDLDVIHQEIDYIGVNYYTRSVVQSSLPTTENNETYFEGVATDEFDKTSMGWDIYPQGLTQLIEQMNNDYSLPKIMIMENGAAFDDVVENGAVNDDYRIEYFQQHLNVVEQLIDSGISITAYFAWSFLDNFEWAEGYDKRFGLVYIDFESQERIPKNSAYAYARLLEKKCHY